MRFDISVPLVVGLAVGFGRGGAQVSLPQLIFMYAFVGPAANTAVHNPSPSPKGAYPIHFRLSLPTPLPSHSLSPPPTASLTPLPSLLRQPPRPPPPPPRPPATSPPRNPPPASPTPSPSRPTPARPPPLIPSVRMEAREEGPGRRARMAGAK